MHSHHAKTEETNALLMETACASQISPSPSSDEASSSPANVYCDVYVCRFADKSLSPALCALKPIKNPESNKAKQKSVSSYPSVLALARVWGVQ